MILAHNIVETTTDLSNSESVHQNLKLSHTRIKFSPEKRSQFSSSSKPSSSFRTRSLGHEALAQSHMTPAYEFWPDSRGHNHVRSVRIENAKPHENVRYSLTNISNSNRSFSKVIRNDLPRPLVADQSRKRTMIALRPSRETRKDEDDQDQDQDQYQDDEEAATDEVDNQDSYENINVSPPVDDTNVVAQTKALRRVSRSPVYPPGDLDLLYSDALLVFVKDFNK